MTKPTLRQHRDAFAARHPERRENLRGRDWGVTDLGRGPALVLLPGTLGRGDIFWQQAQALAGRARVITLSYPASGGIADWAGDILALLDRLDIAGADVLGSSLGGYLAQYLAAHHPSRFTRLIAANTLSDTALVAQSPLYAQDLERTPINTLRAGFRANLAAWAAAHPEQGDLVDLLLDEVAGRIPEAELRQRLIALRTAPELPPPALPADRICTIETDDDPLIPPPLREQVRARLGPGHVIRFEDGGHFPYLANAGRYSRAVADFLNLEPGGATP